MELVKQLLLFSLEILELLKSNFILPFNLLRGALVVCNTNLSLGKLLHDAIVLLFGLEKLTNFLIGLGKWLNDLVVSLLLIHLLLLFVAIFLSSISKLILQLLNDIEISVGDLIVIIFDLSVFLSMFSCELSNSSILLLLNHSDLSFSLVLHFSAQVISFGFEFKMNFIADSFKFLSFLGLDLVLLFGESIKILFMSLLLFFDTHLD